MNYKELSNDEILKLCPAAGAPSPFVAVSSRYNFVSTITAINLLRDAGWLPVFAGQARVNIKERFGYQKHLIRFTHRENILQTSDNRMDILLYNSHDRGCSFQLMAGIYRFVCSNGLVIGDTSMHFRHKHINFNNDEFVKSSKSIADNAGKISGLIDQYNTIELTPDEKGIYAESAKQIVYGDNEAPVSSLQILTPRRSVDRLNNNLWTTFNIVQENILKGGLTGRNPVSGLRQKTRAITSLDKNIKLNKALWTLAEKMAELKTR